MDSLRLFVEIWRFWRGGWLPMVYGSSQRAVGTLLTIWQHFVLTALQSDLQYFLVFRLSPSDCTFLEIDASTLESLSIARLFLDSIACQQPEPSVRVQTSFMGPVKADPWQWNWMQR